MIKLMNLFLEVKSDYDKWLELDNAEKEEIANVKKIHQKLYKSGKIKDDDEKEIYADDAFLRRTDAIMHKYAKLKDRLHLKSDDVLAMKGDLNAKYIYHYTTAYGLVSIIDDDAMAAVNTKICFTTHNNLYKRKFIFSHPHDDGFGDAGRTWENSSCKIKLDLKKMIADGYIFHQGEEDGYGSSTYPGEEELYLNPFELRELNGSTSVDNITKYIVEVFIVEKKEFDYDLSELENLLKSKNIRCKIV